MAKIYELVPAKPYRKLKKDMAAIKEQARNKVLVEELLRSNLKSQKNLTDIIKDLTTALGEFNKVIAEEKKIGVKNIKNKLQDVLNLNTELIQQVSNLTDSLKKVLKTKKPTYIPKFTKSTLPTKQYKEIHDIPITYRRTKEVGK